MQSGDSMTLVEFLLARITDDEATARSAPAGPWTVDEEECCVGAGGWDAVIAQQSYEAAPHIARFDPTRVLAECAAKRRIIAPALPQDTDMLDWPDESPAEGKARRQGAAQALHFTLCYLATVYSDHPDFQPAWAHPGRRP